jgi:hypothetical protein
MTIVNLSFPDFSAGEISRKLNGRFDTQIFYKSGRRVENMIVDSLGPAKFREGTIYAGMAAGNNEPVLYTFKYGSISSYILEFTPLKLRFWKSGGRVEHDTIQNISSITQANPAVVTYEGDNNFSNGDSVYLYDVVGMTEVNANDYSIANVNTTNKTFELVGVDSSSYSAYVSGGKISKIVELATLFEADQLKELSFAQNGRDLYIAHKDHSPKKITYTNATNWNITDHSPTGGSAFLAENKYPSAVGLYENRLIYGGSNLYPSTLFFSKADDPDNFTVGTEVDDGIEYVIAGNIGRIRWIHGTDKFLAIGAFGDVLKATGGLDGVITPSSISIKPSNSYGVAGINPSGKGTSIYYIQSNDLTLRSFEYDINQDSYVPVDKTTVADHIFHKGCDQIAFSEGSPNIIWGTRDDGQFVGMSLESGESVSGWHRHKTDGFVVSVASLPRNKKYDQLWIAVKRKINGSDKYFIEYKSDPVQFESIGDYLSDQTISPKEAKKRWQNVMYERQKEYIHIDAASTYDGSRQTVTLTPGATSGDSVTFTASGDVFSSDDIKRQLWRKSITGEEYGRAEIVSYISPTEVTCKILEDFNSVDTIPVGEWYFTTNQLSGLKNLDGKTCKVCADGGQHPDVTVSNASASLDIQASVVHVGLGYVGYLESNDLEGGGLNGTAQTKRKTVFKIGIRFFDTQFAKIGTTYTNLRQINFRNSSMRMDRPVEMFSGDVVEPFVNDVADKIDGGRSREKRIIISQDQPFPCNVSLLVPYMNVSN